MTITITKAVFVISLFLITPQSLQRRFVHDHHNHPVSYCAMRRIEISYVFTFTVQYLFEHPSGTRPVWRLSFRTCYMVHALCVLWTVGLLYKDQNTCTLCNTFSQ